MMFFEALCKTVLILAVLIAIAVTAIAIPIMLVSLLESIKERWFRK